MDAVEHQVKMLGKRVSGWRAQADISQRCSRCSREK
jgi:hypothetical protein